MKVFMNAQGQYLKWHYAQKSGFSTKALWFIEFVNSIHDATVAGHIPGKASMWEHGVHPKEYVVAEIEATVETTRVVTLVKVEEIL